MNRRRQAPGERGFTLVELLIVMAVIGLLAAIAVVNLKSSLHRARQMQTMTTMRNLGTALHAYETDQSRLPPDGSTMAQLQAILSPGLFNRIQVRDGWQRDMAYSADAAHYTLRSYGSDGVLGPADVTRATRNQFTYDLVLVDGIFTASPESY